MAKFMVLYNSSVKASEGMANATADEMKKSMDEWIAWKDEAVKTVKFEFGMPLEAVGRITHDKVTESDSKVSGYAMMEGEKEAVEKLLQNHPHLQRHDASIELLELLSMPGIDA